MLDDCCEPCELPVFTLERLGLIPSKDPVHLAGKLKCNSNRGWKMTNVEYLALEVEVKMPARHQQQGVEK